MITTTSKPIAPTSNMEMKISLPKEEINEVSMFSSTSKNSPDGLIGDLMSPKVVSRDDDEYNDVGSSYKMIDTPNAVDKSTDQFWSSDRGLNLEFSPNDEDAFPLLTSPGGNSSAHGIFSPSAEEEAMMDAFLMKRSSTSSPKDQCETKETEINCAA
jgi:hypothetical protein